MNYQERVNAWMLACFGHDITDDKIERNYRFLEESLELFQACEGTKEDALKLVEYVFGRDKGTIVNEVGGVSVTLAALCTAQGVDTKELAEEELRNIWTKIEKIRKKHQAKQIRTNNDVNITPLP